MTAFSSLLSIYNVEKSTVVAATIACSGSRYRSSESALGGGVVDDVDFRHWQIPVAMERFSTVL